MTRIGSIELLIICAISLVILLVVAGGIGFLVYQQNRRKQEMEEQICSACGKANPGTNHFCGNCGAALE